MSTMRMGEMKSARRWLVPGLCVVFAAAYAAVFLAHDRPLLAAVGAGVMLAYGIVLVVFSRRSEAVALLREDAPDERRTMITTKAAATTLYVLVVLALTMVFVQLARGEDPGAWAVICGVGGLTFIVSIGYESRRS
jgi:drug/metabolite transporter (DMT)-like permease